VLKISITETKTELRWTLEGRLAGPWVAELRKSWKSKQRSRKGRACIVDLHDVISVDQAGEKLLRGLLKRGAQLAGTTLYLGDLLQRLKTGDYI
jgi:ABC-type transporter Mla MlaB component